RPRRRRPRRAGTAPRPVPRPPATGRGCDRAGPPPARGNPGRCSRGRPCAATPPRPAPAAPRSARSRRWSSLRRTTAPPPPAGGCAGTSPLDAPLALLPRVHRMADLAHLRHQVRDLDEPVRGVPPGDDDVLDAGTARERLDDVVQVQPAPFERVGELVQDVEAVRLGGQVALDLRPALPRVLRVVVLGAPLADPRPALAHLVPGDGPALAGLAQHPQGALLPDPPLRRL